MATKTPTATGLRITIGRDAFARGLAAVSRAISHRSPMPILSHVKLEAANGSLVFTATDLEVGIEARVPADVHGAGSVAMGARTLQEIVGKLPPADVELVMPDGSAELTLRCARSKFTLRGQPGGDFPALPAIADDNPITLPVDQLLAGIRQTIFATAPVEKAVICGVYVKLGDGKLEFAATDGYRLSCRESSVEAGAAAMGVIVPRRAMDELARQLDAAGGGTVTIRVAPNQLAFTLPDRFMTCRLIDGSYPNYRSIIPARFERQAVLDRVAFLAAVERVSIMAGDREAHTIQLEFAPGELRLAAATSEVGDSAEVLTSEYSGDPTGQGEPFKMAFNADYLADALKHLDGEAVQVLMNGPLTPAILHPSDNTSQTMLVMPINRV